MRNTRTFIRIALAVEVALVTGCSDVTHWRVEQIPTTDAQRAAIDRMTCEILSHGPQTLQGNDQDWDDAIRAAYNVALATHASRVMVELNSDYRETGKAILLPEMQPPGGAK